MKYIIRILKIPVGFLCGVLFIFWTVIICVPLLLWPTISYVIYGQFTKPLDDVMDLWVDGAGRMIQIFKL